VDDNLYEIKCFDDDEQWLEQRKLSIGSSDAATIMGVNPWGSRLRVYSEKVGDLESENLDHKEHVLWGKILEPVIINEYAHRTGRCASHDRRMYVSTVLPWAAHATIDGFTWLSPETYDERGVLEIKTTSAWLAEAWEVGPPESVRVQTHHQMLITGATWATAACLIGGQQLVWADIKRDETLIRKMSHHCAEFWEMVKSRTPPAPDSKPSTTSALAELYPFDNEETIELPASWQSTYDTLADAKKEKKRYDTLEKKLTNHFKAEMKQATKAVLPSGDAMTWRKGKKGRVFRLTKEKR
jgi:putative phage-type endonuclease